jgi:hypothetical protein
VQPPSFWVIPAAVAKASLYEPSSWGKVYVRHVPDHEQYKENWKQIREFLQLPAL